MSKLDGLQCRLWQPQNGVGRCDATKKTRYISSLSSTGESTMFVFEANELGVRIIWVIVKMKLLFNSDSRKEIASVSPAFLSDLPSRATLVWPCVFPAYGA